MRDIPYNNSRDGCARDHERIVHRVHIDANIHGPDCFEFAEMPVPSEHDAYELHQRRRIGIALYLHDARLRLVGEYERKLGIAGERGWTG